MMKKSVVIDCFPQSISRFLRSYAVVPVDVIRACTTIVTAVATGRRCFPVPSFEAARVVSARLTNPLWAGEVGGTIPEGFEMNNSPTEVAMLRDTSRPLILLSSSGTRLIYAARECESVYVGCLRNLTYLSRYLADRHPKVAVIGAGNHGEFREEDQMCCAWLAGELLQSGYRPEDRKTQELIDTWPWSSLDKILYGKSAAYLHRSGQVADLSFILNHIDDLDIIPKLRGDEIISIPSNQPGSIVLRKPISRINARVVEAF